MKENNEHIHLPEGPEDIRIFQPSQWFFSKEVSSGILLLFASLTAIIWANSTIAETYHHILHADISISVGDYHLSRTFAHWINDGFMTLFFFTVGLEIKREILAGELSSPKLAMFPIIAAIGGMIVPGLIYMAFNHGTPYAGGWGIPVATDIAFSLGALAIFGKKVPFSLRIFLTAFAIADDLGGVIIIAFFYTKGIVWKYLLISAVSVLVLALANMLWIRWIPFYVLMGFITWLAMMGSGVHPTIAGVLVALCTPVRSRYNIGRFVREVKSIMDNFRHNEEIGDYWYSILMSHAPLRTVHSLASACRKVETPLQRLEHILHPWVAFLILPIFALANAGLTIEGMSLAEAVAHPVTLGIGLGLLVGKPVGVLLFSYLATKTGLASLPEGVRWSHIAGAAMLGGIGFTISLFISGLSFSSPELLNYSKLGILGGSALSGIAGILFLTYDYIRDLKKWHWFS